MSSQHLLLSCLLSALLGACARAPVALQGVRVFSYPGGQHTDARVTYAETPPAGGPHNPTWQNCGAYSKALFNEYAVHSMEHGAVWITYRPGLNEADLNTLRDLIRANPYTLLSPYPGLKTPLVVSAWNAQLPLKDARDARLSAFITQYASSRSAPEPGAPCQGGTPMTR